MKIIKIDKIFKKIKDLHLTSGSEFKINNLSMAIEAVKLCNLKKEKIYKSLKKIKDVSGRLELVRKFPNNIKVFIDYAHTPDALYKVLQSLNHEYGKNISLVFEIGRASCRERV